MTRKPSKQGKYDPKQATRRTPRAGQVGKGVAGSFSWQRLIKPAYRRSVRRID